MRRTALLFASLLALFGCSSLGANRAPANARPRRPPRPEAEASIPGSVAVDRVVVRWYSPETGGVSRPQFVLARELAFEARLEALADPDPDRAIYRDRHVRAALDRHIAETLLASLDTEPARTPGEIAARAESARTMLEQRVGGRDKLVDAAYAEGISSDELDALLRRQAKASLYLDRMIAPMLEPTEADLLSLYRSGQTPFSGDDRDFDKVKDRLKR
ncbi:MAG: hypothetical protein R3B70_24890, partial [Polyangiaceae bacterium]